MTSTGVKKFKNMSSAGKVMAVILWDEEGLILWGCYLWRWHWTLDCYSETRRSLNVCLCALTFHPRKMPELLLHHENTRSHKCAHHWGIHKICVNRFAAPTLPSRSHIVRFSSVCRKDSLWENCFMTDKALNNITCGWLQRRESNFYRVGIPARIKRWKKTVNKDEDYTFSSVLVKCCEIFIL